MMGTAEVDSTKLLIDHFNLPLSVEEVISLTHQGYVKYFPEAKLLPGEEKLVRHLHSKGVQIAVATGSSEKKYDLKITHHKELFSLLILFSLFSHVVFASDDPEVRQGKPCPDVFTVCAKRFPSPLPATPSNVLVFEDASNGVEAAVAAGMPCVLVPDVNLDITKVKDKAAEVLKCQALTVLHCSQVMLISRSYLLHHVKVSYYHNI
ncbi:hypothetical protein EB796_021606 [Bugula neritina]|uniref:HDHD1 n=1 Tax=Bugula neritina TaxID=10212 RepID=A0A7J7J1S2_BUGNE|nr:hypothetical protein EB796_021606 [Bugula neritina]